MCPETYVRVVQQAASGDRLTNVTAAVIRLTDKLLISSELKTPNSTPLIALETGSAMFIPALRAMIEV